MGSVNSSFAGVNPILFESTEESRYGGQTTHATEMSLNISGEDPLQISKGLGYLSGLPSTLP